MLVLTRKAGDYLYIGAGIRIKVLETGRGSIRLGIEAPPEIPVLRGELQTDDAGPPARNPRGRTFNRPRA